MKVLLALVALLAVISLAASIPTKKDYRPPSSLQVAFLALLDGELPQFNEKGYTKRDVLSGLSLAFTNGVANKRFGQLLTERINKHPRGRYLLTYKEEPSVPGAHEWDLRLPESDTVEKTFIFTAEGEWRQQ